MKKNFGKLCMGGVLLFSLSMSLTSCDPYLDDILGEWSRPTPGGGSSSDEPTPITNATPLTVEAITAGTITVTNPKSNMKFSKNGATKTNVGIESISVAAGDKVEFYGTDACYGNSTPSLCTKIGGDGDGFECKVYGNIMSLLYEDFATNYTALTADNTFKELFKGNAKLTDASGLLLPATTLAGACYYFMFQGCTNLAAAPKELPATTLAEACYYSMFQGCTSLATIPEALLPATTLADQCYRNMFNGCTGLTTIPEALLPATTLAYHCYGSMFENCTGLTKLPEKLLPATTLANQCYQSMFMSCTGLTTLPEKLLPATNLAEACYPRMFQGCTGLTTAPALPATKLADCCYSSMFYGCEKLEQTPHLAAETSELKKECYFYMFAECKGLTKAYVKANYTDVSDVDQCEGMFSNCKDATTSTFYSADAGSYKSAFGLNSWQTAAYE